MESVKQGGDGSEVKRGSKLRRGWARVTAKSSSFLYQP